jgi:5-methylcytosine-specific restriction endonuclease McrA
MRNKYGVTTSSKKPWEQDYGDNWDQLRELALIRDHYCCRKCGKSVRGTNKRVVHHIISLSKGGVNALHNLKTECTDCHDKDHPHLQKQAMQKKLAGIKEPAGFQLKKRSFKKSSLF